MQKQITGMYIVSSANDDAKANNQSLQIHLGLPATVLL